MKVTETQFWDILAKNYGLFARTAQAIEKEFKCTMNRVSVMERAKKQPERLKDIEEQGYDSMEAGFKDLMKEGDDNRLRLDACRHYAKYKGRGRGYVEKQELEHSGNIGTGPDVSKLSDKELSQLKAIQEKMSKGGN